ncbi:MAG: BrnT family toxin [Elusimicrobiota bacterium]
MSFEEASTIFGVPFSVTIIDPLHSKPGEKRFVTIGQIYKGRISIVVHCEQKDTIRIISARWATRRKRKSYEECK